MWAYYPPGEASKIMELPVQVRIYHNPGCSKSRAALALLEARGIAPEIVHYLTEPPSKATLKTLLGKLGVDPAQLVRATAAELELLLPRHARTEDHLLDLLVRQPRLLQRPIVEVDDRARIGRPPERVLELFE